MGDLWILFSTFARIGAFTFGGGYVMLPMLQREVVDRRGWATEEELLDYFAVAQCTPGVIAVNVATFIGYKRRGILGSIIATLGVIVPSLIIITIIAALLAQYIDNPYVAHAFAGIRVVVAVLIVNAVIKLFKSGVKGRLGFAIFIVTLGVMLFLPVSPIIVVVVTVTLGIILLKAGRIKV